MFYSGLMAESEVAACLHNFTLCGNRDTGGGGGSFLMCEDLGRMFDNSFLTCASFF